MKNAGRGQSGARHQNSPVTTSSLATPSSHCPSASAALANQPPAECPTSTTLSAPVSAKHVLTVSLTCEIGGVRLIRVGGGRGREGGEEEGETIGIRCVARFIHIFQLSSAAIWGGAEQGGGERHNRHRISRTSNSEKATPSAGVVTPGAHHVSGPAA